MGVSRGPDVLAQKAIDDQVSPGTAAKARPAQHALPVEPTLLERPLLGQVVSLGVGRDAMRRNRAGGRFAPVGLQVSERKNVTDDSMGAVGNRVLFENEHVRVWENLLEPGEESPVHRHDHDYLAIDIEGDRVIHNPVRDGDFPRMEYEVIPGSVGHLRGGVTETAINTGATRFRTILVELLDNPR